MNKLMSFMRANKGKGAGFVARADDEPELLVYDVIVSSDADASWLGGASAEAFVRALSGMSADRVHVRVNSPGGDAFAGVAMANAIRAYPGEVVVHVDGYAASAAGFLTAAAPRVVMGAGAMIMVHKAWTIALGNSDDLMKQAAVLEKLDGQQVALFSEKNKDYDWQSALAAETWFTADEAIAVGLATEKAGDKPAARAFAFDLSAYENAPAVEPVAEFAAADLAAVERRKRVARVAAFQIA
jgi:ATP-dependent Clp protease protease subunit